MLAALTPIKARYRHAHEQPRHDAEHGAIGKTGCAPLAFQLGCGHTGGQPRQRDTPAPPQDLYAAMHHTRNHGARPRKVPVLVLRPDIDLR
jgi:hypothetical protein